MVRDARGRFIKGGPGGPGRPPSATEAEYAEVFREVVPLERFRRIVQRQAERAERGDILAFNAITSRLVPERRDLTIEHSGSLQIVGLEEMLDRAYGPGDNPGDNPTEPS